MRARLRHGATAGSIRSGLALWRRSIALVVTAAPRQALLIGLLLLGQAFLPLATLWASRGVVNAAAQLLAAGTLPLAAGSPPPLAGWIVLAVATTVVQQLLSPLYQTVQQSAADRLTTFVNGEILTAAGRWRGLTRFEDPAFADHLATARNRAARGPLDLVAYGARFVRSLVTLVAMGVALGRLHPAVPFLVVLAALPQALQEHAFADRMGMLLRVQSQEGREIGSYVDAVLGASAAKEVRLFDLGGFFLGRYATTFGHMTAAQLALRRQSVRRMAPAQALSAAMAAAVYLFAINRVLTAGFSLGDLVFFAGALLELQGALASAGFQISFFAQIFTWLPSLFVVLDAGPDLPSPAVPLPAPRPIRAGLVFEHVSFRYPGASSETLRDISFTVQPDERLALVGRNGAGKTTLVKLFARLYDPTAGRILLDGVDLRDYAIDDLRCQVGVIFQDFVTFPLTAQENVGLGDVARVDDLARVQFAARRGGAAELLDRLPQTYATRLGTPFGGVNLSGGQWQKIALSRACMRDAQLLILDEPTAALDVQAEYEVYLRFAELTKGAMTVLVSHRFSTVRMAEHIVFLDGGRLAEEGTHAELLARDGGYAHLYRLQAGLYQ